MKLLLLSLILPIIVRLQQQFASIISSNITVYNGGCLIMSGYCLNGGSCGINGNCICKKFFYGTQCENTIAVDKRVTLYRDGVSQGHLFFICFAFLVLFPLLSYIFYFSCMRLCSDPESDIPWKQTFLDAFFCLQFK